MSFLRKLSVGIMRVESAVGMMLGAAVMALILLNVVTRSMGQALFWVDEAAISAMVWMALLGASVAIHHRNSVAVTLLPDALRGTPAKAIHIVIDLAILGFCVALLVLCWRWFDPLTLARSGFDFQEFSGTTFNFIYAETSTTLGIPKFWLWLIVPVFAFDSTIHALSNLTRALTGEALPSAHDITPEVS